MKDNTQLLIAGGLLAALAATRNRQAAAVGDVRYMKPTEAAADLRKALKQAFPGIKFSVRGSTGTSYGRYTVTWTDGPTEDQVQTIGWRYESQYFDPMDDSTNFTDNAVRSEVTSEGDINIVKSRIRSIQYERKYSIGRGASMFLAAEQLPPLAPFPPFREMLDWAVEITALRGDAGSWRIKEERGVISVCFKRKPKHSIDLIWEAFENLGAEVYGDQDEESNGEYGYCRLIVPPGIELSPRQRISGARVGNVPIALAIMAAPVVAILADKWLR